MSQTKYAEAHGIGVSSFQYWIRKLREERAGGSLATPRASKLAFVEVLAQSSRPPREGAEATLHGAGFSLEIARLPEPSWMASFAVEAARLSRC